VALSVIASLVLPAHAQAQPARPGAAAYPERPIRLVVAFPTGGGVDVVGRIAAQKLADALGQPVVVDNRPGAGGNIAADIVAKSAPDGHTLLHTNSGLSASPSLYKSLRFDPARDLAPLTQVSTSTLVMVVHPSQPVKTVADIIRLAKAQPGKVTFGSSGIGASDAMACELLAYMTGIKALHVPYKGNPFALADLMGGRLTFVFSGLAGIVSLLDTGKLRALAVSTAKRTPALPDVPTVAEAGVPGYEVDLWYAMFAPAGTPPAVLDRLQAEIAKGLNQPDVRERLRLLGVDPVGGSRREMATLFATELAKWKKVVEAGGVKTDPL